MRFSVIRWSLPSKHKIDKLIVTDDKINELKIILLMRCLIVLTLSSKSGTTSTFTLETFSFLLRTNEAGGASVEHLNMNTINLGCVQ